MKPPDGRRRCFAKPAREREVSPANDGDDDHCNDSEVKNSDFIQTENWPKQHCHPLRQVLRAEDVVEDDF